MKSGKAKRERTRFSSAFKYSFILIFFAREIKKKMNLKDLKIQEIKIGGWSWCTWKKKGWERKKRGYNFLKIENSLPKL